MFAAGGAVRARIEVLREERPEIEFVEGIGRFFLGNFFHFFLQKRFIRVAVWSGRFLRHFIEDGIRHNLLVDHLPQLQPVQRQHADHLHETRREDLLLRDAKIQFGCKPVHRDQLRRKPSPR
jgi:hypothetical protein